MLKEDMSLYEIRDALRKKENAVFTLNEFARAANLKKEVARVYAHRMKKQGLLLKVERNKFATTDDPFIIASQMVFPCYISLTSALYLHNIIPQVIDTIYILTPRQKKQLTTPIAKIHFIKIKPKLLFGYKKIKKGESFIMLADIEKTIVDCLLFLRYCRLPSIFEALKKAESKKLGTYASLIGNEGLVRRLGYLLDAQGKEHGLKRKNNAVYKLNPSLRKKGILNKKWYLYINENVD